MQVASLLLAEASQESRTVDAEHAPQLHRYGRRVSFQLWEDGTRLRLHSANAPDTPGWFHCATPPKSAAKVPHA